MARDRNLVGGRNGSPNTGSYIAAARGARHSSRPAITAAGATASVLLHLALLTPVFSAGTNGIRPVRPPLGFGAARTEPTDEIAFELVTVTEAEAPNASVRGRFSAIY
jgi:hypothetical protein